VNEVLLSIQNLHIHYTVDKTVFMAVNGIDLDIRRGETLGLVGETGAGKTTTSLGILRLVPTPPGKLVSGSILFENEDICRASTMTLRRIRGKKISMISQDPMTSLNPIMTVGSQIAEVIRQHEKLSAAEAALKAKEMLRKVGIPPLRYDEYPHQFSGGMKQRVVIAIALACNPELLIADEPTTALDVTIQAQVLELMNKLKTEFNTAILLITHDLGVVAESCNRVAIMYSGEIVEYGSLEDIYEHTLHPYTIGLFNSLPDPDKDIDRLEPIQGLMPDPSDLPPGCKFHPRCPRCTDACRSAQVKIFEAAPGHGVRCLLYGKGVK
jgi:peptide/nickel transport system ATP-binding protein